MFAMYATIQARKADFFVTYKQALQLCYITSLNQIVRLSVASLPLTMCSCPQALPFSAQALSGALVPRPYPLSLCPGLILWSCSQALPFVLVPWPYPVVLFPGLTLCPCAMALSCGLVPSLTLCSCAQALSCFLVSRPYLVPLSSFLVPRPLPSQVLCFYAAFYFLRFRHGVRAYHQGA